MAKDREGASPLSRVKKRAVAQDYQDGMFTGVTDVVKRIGGDPRRQG